MKRTDGQQAWLHDVAELASVMAHEFNNMLNGLLLHITLLEQEAPEGLHGQIQAVRRLGHNAAAGVRQFQQFLRKGRPALGPVDLNAVVTDALNRVPCPARLELAPDLPAVAASGAELGRLVEMLLAAACGAVARGGEVTVRTGRSETKVLLVVEDTGPPLTDEMLLRIFDPFVVAREGVPEPGLTIAKSLARRLQGGIRAENRPEGGVRLTVDLSPAPAGGEE